MLTAPTPPNEEKRLASLVAHELLDSAPDPAFDDVTAMASEWFGVPVSLVSLIDTDRQWFKSKVGTLAAEPAA